MSNRATCPTPPCIQITVFTSATGYLSFLSHYPAAEFQDRLPWNSLPVHHQLSVAREITVHVGRAEFAQSPCILAKPVWIIANGACQHSRKTLRRRHGESRTWMPGSQIFNQAIYRHLGDFSFGDRARWTSPDTRAV